MELVKNTLRTFKNYSDLKTTHSNEYNSFKGIFFAFSNSQMKTELSKYGLCFDKKEDLKKLLSLGGGVYLLKSEKENYSNLCESLNKEQEFNFLRDDFLISSFYYELSNHEFIYTYDLTDTLNALGLEFSKLTDQQKKCLNVAKENYLKYSESAC